MRRFTKLWATLLLLCIAGVANAAKEYEVDQRFNSLADLLTSGELFSIVNETDGKMFCFGVGNEQDMNYETYSDAYAKSKSYTFKLEAAQGDDVAGYYYLRPYKPDGTLNNVWGWGGYFNSQPATGTVCFCLGLNNQNGQDIKNGAVWALEESDGKFALKNIGTGLYLKEAAPAKYEEVTYFTFCTLKEIASSDPLAEQKEALEAAIAQGKMFNALAYSEASFTALGTAITAGEAALAAADATAESLTDAKTAIETAQAALALKDGYIELTQAQFFEWDSATEPTTSKATGCAYELFKPSNMVYGNSSVGLLTFADLSAYDKFIVTVSEGTPRILLNRDVNEGQWNANEEESHLIDNTLDGWHNKYFTSENNVFTVDVKQLTADKGFAHIHSIKSRGMVTVTGLYLYKESEAPVAQSVTFDFNAANHATSSNDSQAGDITENEVNTVDGVVMTISPADEGANAPNRYWGTNNGPQLRMYSGKMTIEAPDGKAITKIEIEKGSKWSENNTFNGEAAAEATWEGNSTNVVLAVAANSQMNKVIVTLADKNGETTTYKEPLKPLFADGKYYFYNIGTKKYLAAGANWGTHAFANTTGLDYDVAFTAEGKYTLDSQVSNGGNSHFLNGEYNDGAAYGWTLAKVADGVYTISNGTKFLTAAEDGLVTLGTDGTVEAAQWQVKSFADRLAELAAATAENPVNATFLIKCADFGRNDQRKSGWKMEASNQNLSGGEDGSGSVGNNCAESFHSVFTLSQVLKDAPAGKYQLTAQGFYRQDGSDNDNLPFFYANDSKKNFPERSGTENSMTDAGKSFKTGSYTIEPIEVTVFEDGGLTIGAKLENNTNLWCIFDNFQLTYLTSEIPADEFKPAYEAAMAAAQAALANENYASVTGEEKAALEKAIADNTTVEETMAAYNAAISALNAATSAFIDAKADYEALTAAKEGMKGLSFPYATAEKKAAAEASLTAEATSAADAKAKAAAIEKAYRQYDESSALLEGVEGSKNMTEAIANPNAQEAIAEPWAVVLGEGSGGSLNILDGEPLTDGEGNSAYKYFDGGNWGAQAWDVALQQKIALPAGKYQLTVSGRAAADVDLQLFAGEATAKIASIGATGALFGRGWSDASVEFELAEADSVLIGVRGVTEKQYNWMSFTRFRLIQFPQPVEVAHTWNFTKWSEETVANLKAEAAKGTSEGLWSDQEKADSSAVTKELSLENCYWQVGTSAAEGETLTANGQEIAELKGLLFTNNKARSLALAVNYGDCTSANGAGFGPYNGPTYLWLGSKGVEYFTIKNVKAGSAISMGVESHKISDARGVQLFVAGEELKDAEGNAVAAPTTYTEQTWAVPAGEGVVDVVVKNTNGCHIYFIDAEIGEAAPEVNPDEAEKEVPEGWHSVISNGNLAGDEAVNFFTKENSGDPIPAVFTAGAGKDKSRGIVINTPDAPSTDWDAQFFIQANENIPAGRKIHVEFDYMATQEAGFDTQSHAAPGDYIWWYCVGSETANTEWKHFSAEVEVSAGKLNDNGGIDGEYGKACDGSEGGKPFQTVAFNLSKVKTATTFHFDNIVFWVSDVDVSVKDVKGTNTGSGAIYDLQGRRVAKPARGLYIINGKKVMVK